MPPIRVVGNLRFLTPTALESQLLGAKAYTKQAGGWTDDAKRFGILFDLSRVEWVELGTVVQLTLLSESALRNGIPVTVALPLPHPRRSEAKWIETTSIPGAPERALGRIDNRRKVLSFLNYLRFLEALEAQHLGDQLKNLTIIADFDESDGEADDLEIEQIADSDDPQIQSTGSQGLYRFIFPLVWLSATDRNQSQNIAKFLAGVIGEPERGLEAVDADAISNVIIYELLDNVSLHAGVGSRALVAAWARPDNFILDAEQYIDCERPYLNWLSERQISSVEVVVGDSGPGVPATLGKTFRKSSAYQKRSTFNNTSKILQWAFDRWSSSRPTDELRGTRGLYRVNRVVSKYQGIVTIRSENEMAGWDHGGASYDEPIAAEQKLPQIPGSILRCRIPSFHEDYSPRVMTQRTPRELSFEIVKLGILGSNGIEKSAFRLLRERLGKAQTDEPACVLAVAEGGHPTRVSVEETLKQCVESRHPGALVILGLPGGWDLIELGIDSVNSEHEKMERGVEAAKPEHFEIWDPVLVVGPQGQLGWVGTTGTTRTILNELMRAKDGILSSDRIRNLVPDDNLRTSALRHLRSDTGLVRLDNSGRTLELLVTGAEIIGFTLHKLNEYVLSPGDREGILSGAIYRTPSLLLVRKWLNVEAIVERTSGAELVMLALSERVKKDSGWLQSGPANTILADSTVSPTHLEVLRKYLGATFKETIPGETGAPALPGTRVLREDAKVVVYCDVIAASEAVGRCLRQVRREGVQAIAVVCVIDARETPGAKIKLPDIEVPVISLTSVSIVVPEQLSESALNIDPVTRRPEEAPLEVANYEISIKALNDLICEKNALHFSHIGRPIGRHFTFYLNAMGIIDSPLIGETFNRVIDGALKDWSEEPNSVNGKIELELWHPSPEPKPSEPARRFAEIIRNQRNDIKLIKTIRRESAYGHWVFTGTKDNTADYPTVVIIDWGALTGTTIMQTIRLAAEAGARNVLACVFLSQLKFDEEAFLRSLRTLQLWTSRLSIESQETRPLPFEKKQPIEVTSRVAVKFLAGFPIEAYSPYECPVCQQLSRLSQEEYPTDLLRDFAAEQKEIRLRLRTREEVLITDPVDFNNQPMSPKASLWMLYFRGTLVEALRSTASREWIRKRLEALAEDLNNLTPPASELLWLLQFLSIESQWLHRPPLYFRIMRGTVARIALSIARNQIVLEGDRLNAIIVLRTSNKSLFAEHFAELFESAINSEQLIKQLLYDVFTYVNRPYHQTAPVFQPLKDQLEIVRQFLSESKTLSTSESFKQTIDVLLSRTEIRLAKARYRSMTPLQAWNELRRILVTDYQEHRDAPESMTRILSEIKAYNSRIERLLAEKPEGGIPASSFSVEWLRRLHKNWSAPRDFFGNTLVELLARIKNILNAEDARTVLGHDAITQLLEMIESKTTISESDFSTLVKRISEDPDETMKSGNWQTLKDQFEWFWEIVFRPRSQSSEPSRLIRFIQSAPSLLGQTVKEVYEERKATLPTHSIEGIDKLLSSDQLVFCPEGLLADVVGHVLGNMTKHWNQASDAMRIRFRSREKAGRVNLTIWNDTTREEKRENRGIGLTVLRGRLRPFQADLRVSFDQPNSWATCRVDVIFDKET